MMMMMMTDKPAPGFLIGNKGAPCNATGITALPTSVYAGIAPGKFKSADIEVMLSLAPRN
jgi:hypothetical protein